MRYDILDTSKGPLISKKLKIPLFCANVLASRPDDIIKDVLTYTRQEVTFDFMDEAIAKIHEAIKQEQKIVIVGDYDCDGILATAILYKAFTMLDYSVGYYIPNRFNDGYGLNVSIVDKLIAKDYHLIISVDNGINAHEAIEHALSNNLEVIITDHHEMDSKYQIDDATYLHPAYSNLDYYVSGGYVAYQLASKLLNKEDDYLKVLAAITIISDVMPLVKGNRLFLRDALQIVNEHRYPTITSLASGFIDSTQIALNIAPKINAMGRLSDRYNPNQLVRYFASDNIYQIKTFAHTIEECNEQRKVLTNQYYHKYQDLKPINHLIFIQDEQLHEGLLGLLASKFVNDYHHGVCIVATKGEGAYKGSIRSSDNINILEIIKKHEDLFITYGGHANAMGISYNGKNYDAIKEVIEAELANIDIEDKTYQVIKLASQDLNLKAVKSLRYLEPYGYRFEAPHFVIEKALVMELKALKGHLHHKIHIMMDQQIMEMVLFNKRDLDLTKGAYYNFIVKLGINEYKGEKINIIVENYDKIV